MWEHDNKKFRTLYATVGTEALNYFLNTGKHKDEDAVRCVFENSYKDEMRMLRLLTDMLSHHLPQVIVNTSIYSMMNSPHVTPLITLTAKSGYDLRDILRQYVDRQSTPALRPT